MPFYHNLNPTILELGPFEIRWYGIIIVIGFILTYFYLIFLSKKKEISIEREQIDSLLLYLIISVVIGARIFYVLFYNLGYFLQNPLQVFFIWQGGLSFHGGLAGVITAALIFCRRNKLSFYELADVVVLPAALALCFGRIANFINGELVGRVTDVPWCVYFKGYEGCRHPSQIYEAGKNLLMFFILFGIRTYRKTPLPKGFFLWLFVVMYSTLRFFIEFVRAPDEQLGFIFLGLTMGQLLNIAMFIVGIIFLIGLFRKE